jgi:hypothetical protein
LPILLAPQLGDLQLVIGNQRLGLLARLALGRQGRRQRRDRFGCRHDRDCHTPASSPAPAIGG